MSLKYQYHLIVPIGTKVVTITDLFQKINGKEVVYHKGTVGEVIVSPADGSHNYMIRNSSGQNIKLKRHSFEILRHYRYAPAQDEESVNKESLLRRIVLKSVIGSHAYGLSNEASDLDIRGAYLPTSDQHWSLFGVPEQIDIKNDGNDECYWELQKFCILALKANPNMLECIYSPKVIYCHPVIGAGVLSIKKEFLSKLVYQTYNGYCISQFKKIEQDVRNNGSVRWKHAMHLIRLLMAGIHLLKEYEVLVSVNKESDRNWLLSVRNGEIKFEEVEEKRRALQREFEDWYIRTGLPDHPNYTAVNDYLIESRKYATKGDF